MYTVLTIDPPSLLLLQSEELKKIIMQKDGRINDEIKIARDPGHTEQGHCPEKKAVLEDLSNIATHTHSQVWSTLANELLIRTESRVQ